MMAKTPMTYAMKTKESKEEDKQASKPGFMSLKKALDMARSGATASEIVASPVPIRNPAKMTSENEKDHGKFAQVMDIPIPFKGKFWAELTWKVQGRPTEDALRQLFVAKRCFTPIEGIQRDPLDSHYKKGGGKENLLTVVHATRVVKQNGDCYNRIAQGDEEHYTPTELQEVREWCAQARHFVVTNGPLQSCFQRLVHAVSSVAKPTGRAYVEPDVVAAVKEMLPWRASYVRNMVDQMPDFEWLQLNLASSAGFPWDKPKKEVLLQGYEVAAEILNGIRDGTVQQLMDKHPQWLVVKFMNKLDRYDSRELQEAPEKGTVRQYFVYGFHWVILFSALNTNISNAMVGFWEDPKSFSAHGFSWQNGGPQRIIDWIRTSAAKGPGIYGIAYSDDQLWVVVCKDGSIHILCPDINRMDLNLLNLVGKLYYEYGISVLGQNVDKTWTAAFRLHCKMAFDCAVAFEYAMVMQTTNFLHSGVPGTPEFDQVASAAAFYHMKKVVGEPADLADAKRRLADGLEVWKNKLGLTVKPFQWHSAEDVLQDPKALVVTKWSFLGKFLMFEPQVGGWVPRSDPVRCISSILCPKSRLEGNAMTRGQMQRVRQICAAGGGMIPQVYKACRSWYDTCRVSLGLTPADPFEPSDSDIVERSALDLDIAIELKGNDFPSYLEICNLYLPAGRKLDLRTMVPTIAGVTGTATGVISAKAMVSNLFDDSIFQDTGKWADSREAPTVVRGDAGADNVANLKTTSASMMGRARPKTAEEQKAADEERRARFEIRMSALGRGVRDVALGKPGKSAKGRQLIGEKGRRFVEQMVEAHMAAVDEPVYEFQPTKEQYEQVEEELAGYDDQAMAEEYYADIAYNAERMAHGRRKAMEQW